MSYEELTQSGAVEVRQAAIPEVMALLSRAARDLATSKLLEGSDEEWAFSTAYISMVRGARALILSEGLRPRGVRGRDAQKTIIMLAGGLLGEQYRGLINNFDRMRRKYQGFIDDPSRIITKYEAAQAIQDATNLSVLVQSRLHDRYAQLSLLNSETQLVSR